MSEEKKIQTNYSYAEGKNGELFIDGIDNIFDKQNGKYKLDFSQLEHWRYTLEMREAWLRSRGCSYFFMIAPNKASVYYKDLPDGWVSSAERTLMALVDHLSSRSKFKFVNPLQGLLGGLEQERMYFVRDDHWNYSGSYIAYSTLMESMKVNSNYIGKILHPSDLGVVQKQFVGQLSVLLDSPIPETYEMKSPLLPEAKEVFSNKKTGRGRVQVFSNKNKSLPSLVFFRDSYGSFMLNYLVESFSRVVAVSSRSVLLDLVESERPDYVVTELCERYLDPVSDDIRHKTFEEFTGLSLEVVRDAK